MALTFFKVPSNKKFNYRPVFYDQKKEEREKRQKAALEEDGGDYEKALRDRMQLQWKRGSGARARRSSNQRLIIIFIVILLLFYLVFFV